MKLTKYLVVSSLLFAACSHDSNTATAPSGSIVASIRVNAPTTSIAVGQSTTLTATALDSAGTAISSATVTWSTSSAATATVANGVVLGIAPGTATITAASGAASSQTVITVTSPISANCSGVTPLSLAVGVPHVLSTAERSTLCVAGGAGTEYVLIPFKADTFATSAQVTFTGSGTSAPTGPPTAAAAANRLTPTYANALLQSYDTRGAAGAAFESQLRRKERTELTPLVRASSRNAMLASMSRVSGNRSAILSMPATPVVGTFYQLNVNGNDACTNRVNHTVRIAAVSNDAIVAVDSSAPAGGFTDTDYATFAATFDTVIFALDTSAFGAPADMDNNGRVLILFTQAVNQLTPPGPANAGHIGGFFFSRDLFPDDSVSPLLQACPASNQGEMFYMPVVDANSVYNGYFTDKAELQIEVIGTLAHEFQHLINASRRLYVTKTPNWDEDVWLNEGMSHIAEELLYFHESGFTPKSFLTLAKVTGTQAALNAINDYQLQNLFRLADYLGAPDIFSPYVQNDSLETRGATYELLRYSLDQSSGSNSSYLHALVNSQNVGAVNYDAVFAATFADIFTAVQQQVIANFFNGSTVTVDPRYTFPSWNYRDVIGNGLENGANPLKMESLLPGSPVALSITCGGTGYVRFRVAANGTATVTTNATGSALASSVALTLVRTQ